MNARTVVGPAMLLVFLSKQVFTYIHALLWKV